MNPGELEEGGLYKVSHFRRQLRDNVIYLQQKKLHEYTFVDLTNEALRFDIPIGNLPNYTFTKIGHLPTLSVIAKECYPELFI